MADHDAIPTHVTEVVRTERINGSFVRITFGGGLDRFRPLGPDDFVYVLLPPPGHTQLPVDTSFRWTDYYEVAEGDRPVGAYYTVRRFRSEVGELDCDVFVHEPAGPVSGWAPHAAPGQPAALWGPRACWGPTAAATDWLLVADEAGLPALAAILERRLAGTPVRAFAEVAGAGHQLPLATGGEVELTWLHRGEREAGTTELLLDAVRRGPTPARTTYAWGGAESRAMTAVRRYLRHEVGLAREQVSMTPYWRHASHAEDPVDADD